MFGQLTRTVYPGGASELDCPVIYDFAGVDIDTCNCIAVGTTIKAGDYLFRWNYYEEAKITDLTIEIKDNAGVVIATGLPLRDPISSRPEGLVTIPADIVNTSIGTYRFTITAQGTCGPVSSSCDIDYCLPIFSEGSSNPALTGAEIALKLFPKVQSRYPGTFREFGMGYKYWVVPQTMMENDGAIARPSITFQPARGTTDFVDPAEEMITVDTATTFNPTYAMEDSYSVNINWGGANYPYFVFRSTYITHDPMVLEVLDWA